MRQSSAEGRMAMQLTVLIILSLAAIGRAEERVQLALNERQRAGTVVTDLQRLVAANSQRFRYQLVQAPQFAFKYFAIENTSLVTKMEIRIDVLIREQLCSVDECKLPLQVNVTGRPASSVLDTPAFQIINLDVTVNQVIDQPCKFDKSVTTQDVNELSDSETLINLGNLNCPRLPPSVSLQLSLVEANLPSNRNWSFSLRHSLIKSKPQSLYKVELVAPAGLDREVCEWHNFTVVATIGDREASARVFVHVDDADDSEPQFLQTTYAVTLRENAPLGEIVRLEAQDADSLPQNTEFEYVIIGVKCQQVVPGQRLSQDSQPSTREADADCTKGVFSLNSRSGALSVLKPLNYEEATRWTVVCGLRVYGSLVNSTAMVLVDVQNMNEAPTISGCGVSNVSRFSVPENLREPRTLCVVRARDEDGDTLKCDLSYDPFATQKYDAKRFFQLAHWRNLDGLGEWNLTTTAFPLDYEDEKEHRVMLFCNDYPGVGRPQLTVSSLIIISVENRNDPPRFTQPIYKHTLLEHDESVALTDRSKRPAARLSVIISNISVTVDPAFTNLSDVQLAILPSATDHAIDTAFQLRGNDLYVNNAYSFDRESREWYNFSLLARLTSDPSLVSTVPIAIEIADRNDNSPVFTMNDENMTIEVRTDTSPGRQVYCCIKAIDRDSDANGRVQYFIAQSNGLEMSESAAHNWFRIEDYFMIDTNSGEIFLNKPLNASLIGQTATLRIEARDQPNVEHARVAQTVLRLQFVKPLQFFMNAAERNSGVLFDFGELHNVVIILMIVGVTILVSGLLIGLIVCIKSKNHSRRAVHQTAALANCTDGHSTVKCAKLKLKPQKNGGYSGFRRASPNHYYDVTTYEPNTATDIDYPEPNFDFGQPNDVCGSAIHIHHAGAPMHFAAAQPALTINLNASSTPAHPPNESINGSLAGSPKGPAAFCTDAQLIGVVSGLPPLCADVDFVTTDIDSGQGSSTSTSKATDLSMGMGMGICNNRNSSASASGTPLDPTEMVSFDKVMPFAHAHAHALHAHDVYCTCSRRHGAATLSRSTTPSPLPVQHTLNLQPVIAQESCSPIVIKSILRGSQAQHYKTMLPKHHRSNQNSATISVHGDDKKRSLLSSDV